MVFSSTVFLFLFLPALLILYYLPWKGNRRKWRNGILLIFSIGFYAYGEPLFVFVMLGSIIYNWAISLFMSRSENHRKIWLCTAVIFDILLLVIFKYASFISENLAVLSGNDNLIISIALPIGISFFTFQMMSYVFDVYYGTSEAQKNPFYVALYITLFPQLIAGPIVRYQDVEREIVERKENTDVFFHGLKRFAYGLAKKVLLANFLAQIADSIFDVIPDASVMTAWLGAISYTLQIYFDFSGYSDMAIGLGHMFGFHFRENFNYPYIASTVTDFWRRWHISLSTWFRDYVYIPLGGNRVKKSRWIMNLFVVWLLTGIWHGANWTFVVWGLIYFFVLLIEKLTGFTKKIGPLTHIYTLLVIITAWVFFRADTVCDAVRFIGYMFGIGVESFVDSSFTDIIKGTYVILLMSLLGATPLFAGIVKRINNTHFAWIESVWVLIVFVLSVFEIVSATYNPFIYFNF